MEKHITFWLDKDPILGTVRKLSQKYKLSVMLKRIKSKTKFVEFRLRSERFE